MKKKALLALLGIVCSSCIVGGHMFVNANETIGGEDEWVKDIAKWFTSTEFMSEEGISFSDGADVLRREWINPILDKTCGLSFKTKFGSNDWKADGEFEIKLGVQSLKATLFGGTLTLSLYNIAENAAQALQTSTIQSFDATKEHEWVVSRILTGENDASRFSLKIDRVEALGFDATSKAWDDAYHTLLVQNRTGSDVTVFSALDQDVQFAEEKNVEDIAGFNGDVELYTNDGKNFISSYVSDLSSPWSWNQHPLQSKMVESDWIGEFTRVGNGLTWQMKASSEWESSADAFRIDIGATDIRIGYNADTDSVYTYSYSKWEGIHETPAIGGYTPLMSGYDPTQWHEWKIVRVSAVNGAGYAVRFYIDGERRAEIFTDGELTDKHSSANGGYYYNDGSVNGGAGFHGIRFVNRSHGDVAFRSTETLPMVEDTVCHDIIEFGGAMQLLDEKGVTLDYGMAVIDAYDSAVKSQNADIYNESNGVAFQFKAEAEWGSDSLWDQLVVRMGGSVLSFNSIGNNKWNLRVYNMASQFGNKWNIYPIDKEIDETIWHSMEITRRKVINPRGVSKDYKLTVRIDGDVVVEAITLNAPMSSDGLRLFYVGNRAKDQSGQQSSMSFRSMLNRNDFSLEEDNICDLTEMRAQDLNTYNERAFEGVELGHTQRVINQYWDEEYVSKSLGAQFVLSSEQPWQTSGTARYLQALTFAETKSVFVKETNGVRKEYFKVGGDGEEQEVATTGKNGVKYKFEYRDWTSDWERLENNRGIEWPGEVLDFTWKYPDYYFENGNIYYNSNTTDLVLLPEWHATVYQLEIEMSTTGLRIKQTPDNKVVVFAVSKASNLVFFQDYVRDEDGNPIEFRTGTYDGDEPIDYYGHTLEKGMEYPNTFKFSRVRAENVKGSVTKLWINDYLGLEIYNTDTMGGPWDLSTFIVCNFSGTNIKAKAVGTFEDSKQASKDELNVILRNNSYSPENQARMNALLEEAAAKIDSIDSLNLLKAYTAQMKKTLNTIWTQTEEAEFASAKAQYIQTLRNIKSAGNYDTAEIDDLLSEAESVLNAYGESQGFLALRMKYEEYSKKMRAVLTVEEKQEIAEAKIIAKETLQAERAKYTQNDYTADNFRMFERIANEYCLKVEEATSLIEIESLTNLAISEMYSVESNATAALNDKKAQAYDELTAYKKADDYLELDWKIILSIVEDWKIKISMAETQDEVRELVAQAKDGMDKVAVKGDTGMIPA